MSLVTHMVLLVIVGALATTPGARGYMGPIVINMSLADGDDELNSSVVAAMERRDLPKEESPPTDDVISTRIPDQKARTPRIEDDQRLQPPKQESRPNRTLLKPLVEGSQAAGTFDFSSKVESDRRTSKPLGRALTQRQMDDVVERFIQYDIGQLRGSAGAQARADFRRLGPTAIPALVRGLNKAAKLRASCPISVISQRLNALLRQTDDPMLIRYAMDNLGRDVDSNDPHYRTINTWVRRWKDFFGSRFEFMARDNAKESGKWWMPEEWKEPQAQSRVRPAARGGFGSPTPARRDATAQAPSKREPSHWNSPESLHPSSRALLTLPDRDSRPTRPAAGFGSTSRSTQRFSSDDRRQRGL